MNDMFISKLSFYKRKYTTTENHMIFAIENEIEITF